MRANFYKNTACMGGVDIHHAQTIFIQSPSEIVKGHTLEAWPYVVVATHNADCNDDDKRTQTVFADGCMMILDGFVITKINHIPVILPILHVYEAVEAGKISDASSSEPFLKMPSVTAEGSPLCVCGVGPLGFNLNCQESGTKLTGIVISPCSVMTRAQTRAVLFRIFDDFKKVYFEGLIDLVDWLLEHKLKVPEKPRQIIKWALQKVVHKLVDRLEEKLKKFLEEQERKDLERKRRPAWPQLNRPLTPQEEEEIRRWQEARSKALPAMGWDTAPPF